MKPWDFTCISKLPLQQILYQVVNDKDIIKSQQFSYTQFHQLAHQFLLSLVQNQSQI